MPSISPGIRFLCWLLPSHIRGTWLTSQGLIRPSCSLPPPTIASWSHPMATTRLWRPSIWNWAAGWCAAMGWSRRSLEWSSSMQLGRKSYCTVDSRYILTWIYLNIFGCRFQKFSVMFWYFTAYLQTFFPVKVPVWFASSSASPMEISNDHWDDDDEDEDEEEDEEEEEEEHTCSETTYVWWFFCLVHHGSQFLS